MTTRKDGTPEWLVERLALGELDAAAAADVRRRLAAEGRDADAELAALAASTREILETHPPARLAAAVRARAAARAPRRWLVVAPLALAGVAALVLVARPAPRAANEPREAGETGLEDVRIKSAAEVGVYRHRDGGDERLSDGARVAAGDLLQLTYRAPTDAFGVLISIDGRGQVTVHWPEAAVEAARLSAKGEVRLPSAYELDDAPAFERFFLVSADAPFPLAPVLDAARALAARPAAARAQGLALPPSLHQTSLTLAKTRKETP
jgi:hypothetical protein